MNARLDFAGSASAEPPVTELVERKVCEGMCGGLFWRPLPRTAREGEKLCGPCRARLTPDETPAKWDRRRGDLFGMRKLSKAS